MRFVFSFFTLFNLFHFSSSSLLTPLPKPKERHPSLSSSLSSSLTSTLSSSLSSLSSSLSLSSSSSSSSSSFSSSSGDIQTKASPGIPQQLADFNYLRFHGLQWFYAKTLSYGETLNLQAFGGPNFGPFTITFLCDSLTGSKLQVEVKNMNSYPISVHGATVSGEKVNAQQINAYSSATFDLLKSTSLTGSSRATLLTSNGYYIALDASGFILTAGSDGMPNSDCSIAGFIDYAHPHGGGYYTGLLSSNLDLSSTTSSSSSFGWVFGIVTGIIIGNVLLIVTVFALVRNRSLLIHSLGFNTVSDSFSCLPTDSAHEQLRPSSSTTPATTPSNA